MEFWFVLGFFCSFVCLVAVFFWFVFSPAASTMMDQFTPKEGGVLSSPDPHLAFVWGFLCFVFI